MAFESLREWIATIEKAGALKRIITEVDWNEEIGAITRAVLGMKEEGPALLFENIKDYQNGRCTKLFTSSLGTFSRFALMLGLLQDTPVKEIIGKVRERVKIPVKPVSVKDGACKQNILRGDEVNILEFPVPKWNPLDGGRYINTYCGLVTKDPETGWTNIGTYRGMVINKNTIATVILPAQHMGQHYHKYKQQGIPMPVAIVYGWDPVLPFTAGAPISAGVCEYDIMGALRQKPVPLVKCETIDLEVPAEAEIVLEGTVPIEDTSYVLEGPFGEFTGYYGGTSIPRPVINVNCITHRDNPIYEGTLEGCLLTEAARMSSIFLSVVAQETLEKAGIVGVLDAFCPPSVGIGNIVRVQINKRYQGHGKQVAACLWGSSILSFKYVVVVEEDVDIYDSDAMEWAITYHVDPKEDLVVFPGLPGSTLDPSVDPQLRNPFIFGAGRWNRLLIDATRTWRFGHRPEWGNNRFPPKVEASEEMWRKVQERWKEYGF